MPNDSLPAFDRYGDDATQFLTDAFRKIGARLLDVDFPNGIQRVRNVDTDANEFR